MSSLPSYVINVDELSEILQDSLEVVNHIGSDKYQYKSCSDTFKCLAGDLRNYGKTVADERFLATGIKVYYSNYVKEQPDEFVFTVKYEETSQKIVDKVPIMDNILCIAFSPPVKIMKGAELIIENWNPNFSEKIISFEVFGVGVKPL